MNGDKTFIPGNWENQTFSPRTAQAGTFEYLSSNKLKFEGAWVQEWEIIKFEADELWLEIHTQGGNAVYKFKRQP